MQESRQSGTRHLPILRDACGRRVRDPSAESLRGGGGYARTSGAGTCQRTGPLPALRAPFHPAEDHLGHTRRFGFREAHRHRIRHGNGKDHSVPGGGIGARDPRRQEDHLSHQNDNAKRPGDEGAQGDLQAEEHIRSSRHRQGPFLSGGPFAQELGEHLRHGAVEPVRGEEGQASVQVLRIAEGQTAAGGCLRTQGISQIRRAGQVLRAPGGLPLRDEETPDEGMRRSGGTVRAHTVRGHPLQLPEEHGRGGFADRPCHR